MRRLFTIMAVLFVWAAAFAQNSIEVQAPNMVGSDEQFNVTFVIDGENSPSSFEWQCPDEFQLVWGPQKGSSTSISIINGKRTKSSQTTYTYVLMPRQAGNYQLPQARATINGSAITSKGVSITVVANSGQTRIDLSQADQEGAKESVSSQDIYLKLNLSKTRAVVGETITANLKLYQRVNISGFEDARFPSFNGFWSQETQTPTNIEFQRENVGDKIYNTAILRGYTLIPQQAGDITIDPAELVCLVNVRAPSANTGSIFDSFFQDDYRTVRKRISTKAVTVHVSPLPKGAPESFGGGVGDFKMEARLTKDSLVAHDAASLKITVTGKGNIALLEAPKISFPPDFEVYDVKTTDIQGGKQFEYPFIPRSHGSFEIGPVEYSYYDIQAGKYKTLSSGTLNLNVARGKDDGVANSPVPSGTLRKDVKSLGNDIRYIVTRNEGLSNKGEMFSMTPFFWIIPLLLIICGAALYFAFRDILSKRSDVVMTRRKGATKMARKRLSKASLHLERNLYSAFYEELHRALLGFVSDKLSMDATDMTKENIASKLSESGVPEDLSKELVSLIDACEYARYSQDQGHDAMNVHFETAVSVISAIDESMKHKSGKFRIIAGIISVLLFSPSFAQAQTAYPDSLWDSAAQAYMQGHWEQAAGQWMAISDLGLESSDLYFNIGNAFFKNQQYASAILYFEKALKLDPSNQDAKFNLEYAGNFIQDRIEAVPEFFLKSWGRAICHILPSDAWAGLMNIFLAFALAGLLVFLLSRNSVYRKLGFYAAILFVLLSFTSFAAAQKLKNEYVSAENAIVMKPVVAVKSSPGDDSVDLFVLHEGTKVKKLDRVGSWESVQLSDGRKGWLKSSDIETI